VTTYARLGSAPSTDRPALQVTWARLPILWWRDVAVVTREPVQLNELDMFTMAAADRLGYLHADVFEQITGLPPAVFAGLARRLHSLALLDWRGGVLRPIAGVPAERADEVAGRSATTTVDLVYLPTTDDLLVIGDGLGDWERADPPIVGAAPLPTHLHDLTVHTLLSERIADRRVANLAENVVAVADGANESLTAMAGAEPAPPLPLCPVVECAATVDGEGVEPRVRIEVVSRTKRRKQHSAPVTLDLTGATGLVRQWTELAGALDTDADAAAKVMQAVGLTAPPFPSLRRDRPGAWRLTVTGEQARILAGHGPLTAPIGLEIRHTHVRIAAALHIVPADREAAALIELDATVQKALNSLTTGLPSCDATQRDRMLSRAWELRYFPLVHALREAEDFDYA
jgi:hypothetical protein